MNINEAKNMLAVSDVGDEPSAINPSMSARQALEIVLRGLSPRACDSDGITLLPIFEKRVHQVCKNRVRPKY